MDFRVLGPVVAYDEARELKLGGPKQRLVLAMLLAARGNTVSTGALIDGLWGEEVPSTAKKMLQGYVHHLRSEVGDHLVTDPGGYSLHIDDDLVDERRFGDAVHEAEPLINVDPRQAADQLMDALALWRGSPYADLDGEMALQPELTRLSELRLVALADRIDADLALGRHELLIGELESLTVEYPLRERFRAQHMLALHRSGRQGEALRVFARTREFFIEEMGIDPSDELADLEERILNRDPSLDIAVEETEGLSRSVRGYELREAVRVDAEGTVYRAFQRSVGREVAIRVIEGDRANDPQFIMRFQSDTARVAKLSHPHIVYVQDAWREAGRVFEVTQWIAGDRLDTYLDRNRPSQVTAIKWIDQIGGALATAHRAEVGHGQVSPGNIVISESGDAYLIDFLIGVPAIEESTDRLAFIALAHQLLFGVPPIISADGFDVIPTPGSPPELAKAFHAALVERGGLSVERLVRSLRRAVGGDVVELAGEDQPPISAPAIRNPYKGLQAFQLEDAGDFFGRDQLIEHMHAMFLAHRLVAVVGPSGSGKSSAVKAGLAARLEAADQPFLVAEMYPGAYPFEELEGALSAIAVKSVSLGDELLTGKRGLMNVLPQILPAYGTELVLVIDQFEELFSLVSSEETRALFLDSLVTAVSDPASRLRVLLSLRADFFDRPLRYPNFGALVEAGLVPVTIPNDEGLAAAIEGPARAVGLEVEPALTGQVIRDVAGQPGGLPLLQYALTEVFRRRDTNVLTLDAYQRSGGVLGALAVRAEELYGDLNPPGKEAIHQAFVRLVNVEEEADDVRRRVTRAELMALEVDRRALTDALQSFASHRLLTFDSDPISRAPTVEVAHEALLREWGRLRGWVEDMRDDLIFRRRLDAAITEWEEAGESEPHLLTGGRLAQFDTWASNTRLALSSREREYLQASAELDQAATERSVSIRRRVMTALAAATLVAVAFGVFALVQRNRAAHQAYRAETARLGQEAGFVAEWNHQLSLLMAVETYRRDPGYEGLNALQRVSVEAGPFLGVMSAENRYLDLRWPAGEKIVASTADEVHLIDVAAGTRSVLPIPLSPPAPDRHPGLPPESGIRAVSPAGLVLVTDQSGALHLVDAASGTTAMLDYGSGATAAAISDDGSLVAVGYPDGVLEVRNRISGATIAAVLANPPRSQIDQLAGAAVANLLDPCAPPVVQLGGARLCIPGRDDGAPATGINQIAFDAGATAGDGISPSGRLVSVGGFGLRAWEVDDLRPLGPEIINTWGVDRLNQYAQYPQHVWFDPLGPDTIVTVGDTFVSQWRISTGDQIALGTVPTGPGEAGAGAVGIASAAQSSRGRLLALTNQGQVTSSDLDDLVTGSSIQIPIESRVMDTQLPGPAALAADPTGSRFAVATGQGILLGGLDGRRLLANAVPIGNSVRPSLSRDGTFLAAGPVNEGIFDLRTRPPTRVQFDVNVEVAQFAGSGATYRFLPVAERDVLLWTSDFVGQSNAYDFNTGDVLADVWGSVVPAFSDDGGLVARAVPEGGTRVERTSNGEAVFSSPEALRAADFDSRGDRVLLMAGPDSQNGQLAATLADLATGEQRSLPAMPGGVFAASFTPDDRNIVAIGAAGAVWLLDATSLDRLRELQEIGDATQSLSLPPAFSPDGELMLAATDGQARLWHMASGRLIGVQFPNEAAGVPHVSTSSRSLMLATASGGNALVWNLDPAAWVDRACRAAGRNMTLSEWRLFGPQDSDYAPGCSQYPAASETRAAVLAAVDPPPDLTAPAPVMGDSAITAADPALPGLGFAVRPGRASWSTGYFQAAVYSALLEELGYEVTDPALHEYPPVDAYVAMANGDFDFWANGWYNQHYTWHDQQLDDGTRAGNHLVVIGEEMLAGGLEGLVITKSVADEHSIESLAQINDDPALAALFDVDGNGIGDIFGCPESWTCDDLIDEMLQLNGWTNLEQVKAGYAGMVANSIARVQAGEPVLQYTWSPSGYLSSLVPGTGVLWVSLGSNDAVLDGSTASGVDFSAAAPAALGDACTGDPCWLGWEAADVLITANADFAAANPAAVALFEIVRLPVEDVSAQNARYDAGENTESDVRRHAAEWIAANRSLVDGWLSHAEKAAG